LIQKLVLIYVRIKRCNAQAEQMHFRLTKESREKSLVTSHPFFQHLESQLHNTCYTSIFRYRKIYRTIVTIYAEANAGLTNHELAKIANGKLDLWPTELHLYITFLSEDKVIIREVDEYCVRKYFLNRRK
jgi:hypothetical protein